MDVLKSGGADAAEQQKLRALTDQLAWGLARTREQLDREQMMGAGQTGQTTMHESIASPHTPAEPEQPVSKAQTAASLALATTTDHVLHPTPARYHRAGSVQPAVVLVLNAVLDGGAVAKILT